MNDDRVYAPIIITTLCRFTHFKRCVNSLSKCIGADKSVLYVGLDYPLKESHWDGYKKICDFLPSITGFKDIIIIKRTENFGAIRNARDMYEIVRKNYDRYIFSEDDNEFSPNFLEYINKGLDIYKNNPDVIAICGYAEPRSNYQCLSSYQQNAYPMIGYNAWGVGYWFDKKPVFDSPQSLVFDFSKVLKAIRLDHGVAIHRMMHRMRTNATSDLQWRIHCAFNNKYCIFPRISKVRNWGYDGSGENSPSLDCYQKVELDTNREFYYDKFDIIDYPEVKKLQKEIYGWTLINYLAFPFNYLLFRITKGRVLSDIPFIKHLIILRRNRINKKLSSK